MNDLRNFMINEISNGRIGEIIEKIQLFYQLPLFEIDSDKKIDFLCNTMNISRNDIDIIITAHQEVLRTIKGHAFEVVFDYFMNSNKVPCIDVGGDNDIDRIVNNYTLQLKTPFINGTDFNKGIVSYKTHKTHGPKSQGESFDYYHKISDFADFLVGLVTYNPFNIVIIPKADLPRINESNEYIKSPMFILFQDKRWLNNYKQLGINKEFIVNQEMLCLSYSESLPRCSSLLNIPSRFIIEAIFIKENFRIWDMNMRGFIREYQLINFLNSQGIRVYPTYVTGLERSDKCDIVLKDKNDRFVRFQVKGLTWASCVINNDATIIDCETQLSRGRVNDHPTQSRLYKNTDFEAVIIAVDPPYTNTLTKATFGTTNYNWSFYCLPEPVLRKHPSYPNRIFSHQRFLFKDLQNYLINNTWVNKLKKEL